MSALIETSELKPMIDFNSGQRFSSSGNNGINGATNVQQRDALIRNTMTPSRTGRGRFNGSPGTSQPVSYSEAFVNAISRRPDLFFMPDDTISNKRPEVPYLRKKIYDRQVIFSFNKELGLNWHRWFETEDQSLFRKNDLHPAETNASFATVYYRHNHKGNTELAITKISKPSGEMITQPLKVPEDITLFTTGPIYKLGENKIVMLYYSSKKRGTGLATIEW